MAITWRPATGGDIEPGLAIQPRYRGDSLVGSDAADRAWSHLIRDPFFASAVLESRPPVRDCRLIGLGTSVLVSQAFADREVAHPRPDINSRLISAIHSGQSPLASPGEVARANAGAGVDVLVLCGIWRDEILSPAEKQEAQTLLATTFTECHAGFRIHRIFHETADEPAREFLCRSVVYQVLAAFPEVGRVIHLMTRQSAQAMHASLGNVLFSFREPVLRLRHSDQALLLAALRGATDVELASELKVTLSAVKARWRSTFARFDETMPGFLTDAGEHNNRGPQKRHTVLSHLRRHPEELRPFAWRNKQLKARSATSDRS